MNKKNNRKGFTIVELVIVIAVIAILATVLVPVFGNVIGDAKNSALLQELKNEHTSYTAKYASDDNYSDTVIIKLDEKFYKFENGAVVLAANSDEPAEQEEPTYGYYFDAASDTLVKVGAGEGDDEGDEG